VQPEHIRKLYRSHIKEPHGRQTQPAAPVRQRGKSPQQSTFFTRSARARHESALLASLCRLLGALPTPAVVADGDDAQESVRAGAALPGPTAASCCARPMRAIARWWARR